MTVGIVGVGLIGGSIGMALKGAGHRLIGFDPRPEHLDKAIERHLIDDRASLADVARADAAFVAVPPAFVVETLAAMVPDLNPQGAVTDCTSVKGAILAWVADRGGLLAERFVGGHPMAGHEKSGPAYASEWMFRGARWLLTPTKATAAAARERITALVKETGAKPVRLDAGEHDRHVAVLSHLPHVVAAALVEMGARIETPEIAAGSWRDLTRVGGVDPELWSQILAGNAEPNAAAIDDLIARLARYRDLLSDRDALRAALADVAATKAAQTKRTIPEGEGPETLAKSASRTRAKGRR